MTYEQLRKLKKGEELTLRCTFVKDEAGLVRVTIPHVNQEVLIPRLHLGYKAMPPALYKHPYSIERDDRFEKYEVLCKGFVIASFGFNHPSCQTEKEAKSLAQEFHDRLVTIWAEDNDLIGTCPG